jgi:DNA-binding MarR family transcriptional regulator
VTKATRSSRFPAEDQRLLQEWITAAVGFRRLTGLLLDEVHARTGLTPSSFEVLWILLERDGHSAPMNHLAQRLGFSTAGITKVTDRLAQAGLLQRHDCPGDRRVVLAVLTAAGATAAERARAVLVDAIRELVVTRAGTEGVTQLSDIMAKINPGGGLCPGGTGVDGDATGPTPTRRTRP